jgi:hypothetical protein
VLLLLLRCISYFKAITAQPLTLSYLPACCCLCHCSFCEAMIKIRQEIADIESGKLPRDDNPLVNAPHPASVVLADTWSRPYSRCVGVRVCMCEAVLC